MKTRITKIPVQLEHLIVDISGTVSGPDYRLSDSIAAELHDLVREAYADTDYRTAIEKSLKSLCQWIASHCIHAEGLTEPITVVPNYIVDFQKSFDHRNIHHVRLRFGNYPASELDIITLDLISHLWYLTHYKLSAEACKTLGNDRNESLLVRLQRAMDQLLKDEAPKLELGECWEEGRLGKKIVLLYKNGRYHSHPYTNGGDVTDIEFSRLLDNLLAFDPNEPLVDLKSLTT